MKRITEVARAAAPPFLRPLGSAALERFRSGHDRLFYERPSRKYREVVAERATYPNFQELAGRLIHDGVLIIQDYFGGNRLAALQTEFQRLTVDAPPGHGEETNAVHIGTRRIAESELFSGLGLEATFVDFAEYYWGKPVLLTATGGTRLDPYAADSDYGSYQWHHDAKRKQFRVMILLSDVPAGGQHMDYIAGSHRTFRGDLRNSRVLPEEIGGANWRVACNGTAGTIVLFGTNGIHRGNRSLAPRRDHWQFTYCAPGGRALQHYPCLALHPNTLARLTPAQRRIAVF